MLTGAVPGIVQAVGTLLAQETPVVPIHDIQGPGASSPIVGTVVITRGIVTGVTADGFFLQAEEPEYDADPMTSEGIFVFTAGAPPAAAALRARVEVTGTVAEFVPSGDPLAPSSTRLASPTVVQLATDQLLPPAVPLSATFPDPAGPFDQLERVEQMRVSAASLTVSGPSQGSIDEAAATGTNDGRFHGVITGVARPFREAGIQAPDLPASGTIPPIPRWDFNPERMRVESAALGRPAVSVRSGDVVTGLVGPLDYRTRAYAILLDETSTPVVATGSRSTTVAPPADNEITVATVNLRRLFDAVDDAPAEPVLTTAAYERRLAKASIAIREHLQAPDIIGVQGVEGIGALNDLALRIQMDGGPRYVPFVHEGSDPEGLDVGVLVNARPVPGGTRVSTVAVFQMGTTAQWTDPATGLQALLFDRPPILVTGTVNGSSPEGFQLVVVITDMEGLTGVDSTAPAGPTTVGDRVRQRRQAQAGFVAAFVQELSVLNPETPFVVLGGFNAFEMNDGQVDVMNVIAGTPPPDNETVVSGDGVDMVNPDFVNLLGTRPPAERYSDVFEGNARNLDHVLVNAALIGTTSARRIEIPRINADYPETHRDDGTTALRFSDRDPILLYVTPATSSSVADLAITNVDAPDPAVPGEPLVYTLTVTNNGPDAAASVSLSDTLPAGTTFESVSPAADWSCATPPVGAGGTITCSIGSFGAGGSATFTLTVRVAPTFSGALLTNTATVSTTTTEATLDNNSATATTALTATTDLAVGVVDTPDPVIAGGDITYTVTVANNGPLGASLVTVTNPVPANATFVAASVVAGSGWTTSAPAVGATGTVVFSKAAVAAAETAVFEVVVKVDAAMAGGTVITDTAVVASATADSTAANDSATASTIVDAAPITRTYFLAEGATGTFFDEDLLIANPNETDAPVTVTFYREGAPSVTETRTVPARSGTTLRVDTLPGLESAAASVQVSSDSDLPLAVERTQFWDADSYAGHTETAVPGPATRWYFAEGAQGYFDTFLLVANPQATPADVTLTFLREGETSVTTTMTVEPFTRKTIPAADLPDLANRSFAIIVDATRPVVAERAMYFGTTAARTWIGGGASAGASAPSTTWYFAEGATGPFFDTFLLLMNPDTAADAQVTLRYLLDTGETIEVPKVVPARGRVTVNVESEDDARLQGAALSTLITSDVPIVAERSVYWPTAEGVQPWGESHISQGATTAAPRWALAEGRSGGALNFHTYVLVANPGTQPAEVTVRFLPESGDPVVKTYVAPALGRFAIDVTADAPELQDRSFITLIEAAGGVPIVVERSLYWDAAGMTWAGGSNALATRLPD